MIKIAQKIVVEHEKVIRRTRAKRNRVLYRTGGYARVAERRRIRRRKKNSKPGQGPSNRTGRLKDGIHFEVDEAQGTVVTGVTPNATTGGATPLGGKTIPEIIDTGGAELLTGSDGKRVKADFAPRPITDPVREPAEQFFRDLIEQERL